MKEHFSAPDRVEWIDDQSANLVFPSEATAQDALLALSAVPISDVSSLPLGETVVAKPLSAKPDIALHVRLAVLSDKKVRGAATRSRYYLFHPDQDPEERRRQRERRYRDRGDDDGRRDRGRRRRSADDEVETYDAGMYDDDEATLADRAAKNRGQRRSRSRNRYEREDEIRRNLNQDKELFPGRPRNRSASPLRDRDGDAQMDADEARAGTSNNRRAASGLKERLSKDNASKELFPTKPSTSGSGHMDRLDAAEEATRLMRKNLSVQEEQGDSGDLFSIRGTADRKGRQSGFAIKGAANAKVTELFPAKFGQNTGKELFTDKLEGRTRQRKKAEDLFY